MSYSEQLAELARDPGAHALAAVLTWLCVRVEHLSRSFTAHRRRTSKRLSWLRYRMGQAELHLAQQSLQPARTSAQRSSP